MWLQYCGYNTVVPGYLTAVWLDLLGTFLKSGRMKDCTSTDVADPDLLRRRCTRQLPMVSKAALI